MSSEISPEMRPLVAFLVNLLLQNNFGHATSDPIKKLLLAILLVVAQFLLPLRSVTQPDPRILDHMHVYRLDAEISMSNIILRCTNLELSHILTSEAAWYLYDLCWDVNKLATSVTLIQRKIHIVPELESIIRRISSQAHGEARGVPLKTFWSNEYPDGDGHERVHDRAVCIGLVYKLDASGFSTLIPNCESYVMNTTFLISLRSTSPLQSQNIMSPDEYHVSMDSAPTVQALQRWAGKLLSCRSNPQDSCNYRKHVWAIDIYGSQFRVWQFRRKSSGSPELYVEYSQPFDLNSCNSYLCQGPDFATLLLGFTLDAMNPAVSGIGLPMEAMEIDVDSDSIVLD